MGLDIRLPIGAMFLFVGVLLTTYGALLPSASVSVDININLTWGVVLLVFGIVMILLGRHGSRTPKTAQVTSETQTGRAH